MKKVSIIIAGIVLSLLVLWIIFLLAIRAQQACHESAYWKAYNETIELKINKEERLTLEKELYNKYYNECRAKK